MSNFKESLLSFAENVEIIKHYGKPISKRNTEAMMYSLKMSAVQANERGDRNGASGIVGSVKLIKEAIQEGQFNSEKLAIILGAAFVEMTKELDTATNEKFKNELKSCITALIAVANLLSKDIQEESGERVSE